MKKPHPVSWLSAHARELPSTMGSVLERAVTEPAHQATVAVSDNTPFGDSVEARLQRADAALERARELEEEAAEKAARAREASEEVDATRAAGDDEVRSAREEADKRVAAVVADAQREADEYVAASASAPRSTPTGTSPTPTTRLAPAWSAPRERPSSGDRGGGGRRGRAAQMADARRLAEDDAAAAREVAEEARQRAERLAEDANARAEEADAARRRRRAPQRGRVRVGQARSHATPNGRLSSPS